MFEYMFYTGCTIFIYCFFRQRHLIRISWTKIAEFSAFLLLVMAFRFAIMENTAINPTILPPFKQLILVPWEDCFFSIPIYFFKDYLKLSKKLWIPITIALSVLFASGHITQCYPWAAITLAFPYFVSYHYGKKYGYGTSIIGHMLYDFTTVLTIKLVYLCNMLNRGF